MQRTSVYGVAGPNRQLQLSGNGRTRQHRLFLMPKIHRLSELPNREISRQYPEFEP